MTPVMASLSKAPALLRRVRSRLEKQGAVIELDALAGFSASETDVLVRLEREAR